MPSVSVAVPVCIPHISLGICDRSDATNRCILVKLICDNVVNREDDLDIIILGFLNKCGDFLRARWIEE